MTDSLAAAAEPAGAGSDQTVFEPGELLESHAIAEPLIAAGVRCHGGFDAQGRYVSPRALKRGPAIVAWQRQHERDFTAALLDVRVELWPPHYPNVAQSKFLIRRGVTQPMIASLTRVGVVEGFGGSIGRLALSDLQPYFAEDLRGTAMDHLTRGLYEAHGRDEAGFGAEGGHRQMWFAARDIAFEKPHIPAAAPERIASDGYGGSTVVSAGLPPPPTQRGLPDDIDLALEAQIARMIRLLFIEVAAHRVFAWAQDVLSDPDLVAGSGEAGRIVGYIRSDERPHVEYLRTVLSEMRVRTFIGGSGRRYAGRELIGRIWDLARGQSLEQSRSPQLRSIEAALAGRPDAGALLEEFHSLGTSEHSAART
jgi:hypothetical protein